MYLHRIPFRLHHYLQQHHHLLPCLHLHRKPDPPNLTFRTLASSQLQPSLLLTTYMLHHHQRADHDPGLQDHVPVDLRHDHIIIAILPNVQYDLVLLFLVFGHLRNTPRTAEPRLHTDEGHRQDAALPWFLDVIDLTQDHVPRHHVTDPEAVKSYFDQLHTHPIRPTSPLPTLMTPGAHGTTATTPTTTTTTLLDPTLLPIHHHQNHLPTHQPTLQHHLALFPSASPTATVKILR